MAFRLEVETDEIVTAFIRSWAANLGARDHRALLDLFHESALFFATVPMPLLGRSQIQTYYEQVPEGLVARASLLCATRPLYDLVHGLAEVIFEAPGGVLIQGRLGLSLVKTEGGWKASSYQLTVSQTAAIPS